MEISISLVEGTTTLLKTLNVCVVMPSVFVVNLNFFFQTMQLFYVETWAGQVGTLTVLVEISRVVGWMLSALEENDVSCCYGIRSDVRVVGAYDIAERIKNKSCYRDGLCQGHNRHFEFSFTKNTSHIKHNDLERMKDANAAITLLEK